MSEMYELAGFEFGFLERPPFTPWQIHSQTSQDAAFSVKPHAGKILSQVFEAIANSPSGLTALELEDVTGLKGSTIRPRLVELRHDRRIQEAGTRPTKSGRQAVVWVKA